MLPMQAGDVAETGFDSSLLVAMIGFRPQTDLAEGVADFVQWYRNYYGK
jgi:UDP-glucuronate 4-epimerase